MTQAAKSGVDPTIARLANIINGQLTFDANIRCKIITVTSSGTANLEFTVTHNLGRVPTGYIWNVDQGQTVYSSSKNLWDDKTFRLKCTGVSVNLVLIVF